MNNNYNLIPLDENVVPHPRPDNWRSQIKNTLISNYFFRFSNRDDPMNRHYDLSNESLQNLILGENGRRMYLNSYGRTDPMPSNDDFNEIANEAKDGLRRFRDRASEFNRNNEPNGGKRKRRKNIKSVKRSQKKQRKKLVIKEKLVEIKFQYH
jgi:hypothetical protein